MSIPRSHLLLIAVAALVLSIVGASGLNRVLASPSSAPPGGNVPEPLNKGNRSQTKEGALTINDGITTGKPGLAEALRVIGGMTVSGGITATGATTSGQFCLGGVCIAAWPGTGSCQPNDPRLGCQGGRGTETGVGGWETLGWGGAPGMLRDGTDLVIPNPSNITRFEVGYEHRLVMRSTVSSSSVSVEQEFFCTIGTGGFMFGPGGLQCITPAETVHQVFGPGGGTVAAESYMLVWPRPALSTGTGQDDFAIKASYTGAGVTTGGVPYNKARLLRRPRPSVF